MKAEKNKLSQIPALKEYQWLVDNQPDLDALVNRYPAVWDKVLAEFKGIAETYKPEKINKYSNRAKSVAESCKLKIKKSQNNPKVIESAIPQLVKSRMSVLLLDRACLAAVSGKTSGKVRLNLINGLIIQKLLFEKHFTRKPASLFWFRFWWRFITQKSIFMPLIKDKGIYCFYSGKLVEKLKKHIGARTCLEIGAGDGTLTRFLRDAGVNLQATDDFSWESLISYPDFVEKMGAKEALEKYQPQVVLCSWPPPGNNFERHIFACKSTETYIVIGSQHKIASGNWKSYQEQKNFKCSVDQDLTRCVLPPDSGHAVLVFTRVAFAHAKSA